MGEIWRAGRPPIPKLNLNLQPDYTLHAAVIYARLYLSELTAKVLFKVIPASDSPVTLQSYVVPALPFTLDILPQPGS